MMKGLWLVRIFLLHCVSQNGILGQSQGCQSQPTCSECLRVPGCAWCKQKDFLKSGESNKRRCDSAELLRSRKCGQEHVIDPRPKRFTSKDADLSSLQNEVVQLRPQNLRFKLRLGVPQEFRVSFQRAEGYPIDLYYLMDLSYSMKDDLEKIKSLGQDILETLQKETETVRIGFGSFVDKTTLPYVSQVRYRRANPCPSRLDTCQPAFSFQNVLPLTAAAHEFKTEVSKQKISGNLDSPEAGFDAIMQAAVCQDKIGWGNVTRILVYTSDDTFHMAGDGRLAGIFQPHDGRCHLDNKGFYSGKEYDYPSVGHLSRVLQANNIQLIFAVTEKSFPAYQALSALIPQSVVGVLKNDSSNVVQLISEAYQNLSSTILLEHEQAPAGLGVSYRSDCRGEGAGGQWERRGECNNVKIQEQVDFMVRLNASSCLLESNVFEIRLQGIRETLKITVETLCDCNCKDTEDKAPHCSGNGTLNCGVCSCDESHLGRRCECERQSDLDSTLAMLASCRQENGSQVCSGHGECECGRCVCGSHYRGQYCECADNSCDLHDDMLCNGKGRCNCGTCVCDGNYTGSACACSLLTAGCVSERRQLCSGQGECECNRCSCKTGFIGETCAKFDNPCPTYKSCVKCLVEMEGSGGNHGNCSGVCVAIQTSRVPEPQEMLCRYQDTHTYSLELGEPHGNVLLRYTELPGAVDKTRLIIGSSVTGIIIVGLLVIIIYRLLLELYDRREYHNFIKAQEHTDWRETQNPLFQGATTTILNPMHTQDG